MTDNIIIVCEYLPSKLKSLFKVWLSNKGVSDDKIAMTAMRWRIFRKNVPTSNAQQTYTALRHLCSRLVTHILTIEESLKNVLYSRKYEVRRRLAMSNYE